MYSRNLVSFSRDDVGEVVCTVCKEVDIFQFAVLMNKQVVLSFESEGSCYSLARSTQGHLVVKVQKPTLTDKYSIHTFEPSAIIDKWKEMNKRGCGESGNDKKWRSKSASLEDMFTFY